MTDDLRPLTLQEQADMVEGLVMACTMRDGSFAPATYTRVDEAMAINLKALASRLARMAPFEREIKRVVTRGN